MQNKLKEAVEQLNKFSFFMDLSLNFYMTFIVDRTGKIVWTLDRAGNNLHSEALSFLRHKNINEFYHNVPANLASKESDITSIEYVGSFYIGKDPNTAPSPFERLNRYFSKNRFETKFYDFNLETSVSLSRLLLLGLTPDYFLGIISFFHRISEISNWSNDINLIVDEGNNLVGFDDNFKSSLKKSPPKLDTPLSEYIHTNFLNPYPLHMSAMRTGKTVFQFPGKTDSNLSFNLRKFFKQTPEGIECASGPKAVPALIRLPLKTDFEHHDYQVEITADNMRKEPPLCILNAGVLDKSSFPDERGLLFASQPLYKSDTYTRQRRISFLLKQSGLISTLFNDFFIPAPGPGDKITYVISHFGKEFIFSVNGKVIGGYFAENLVTLPGHQSIVIGLRGGNNKCRFTNIAVRQLPATVPTNAASSYVTSFHDQPRKMYKVNIKYMAQNVGGDKVKMLKYLRLEDLSIREKLQQLNLVRQKQNRRIKQLERRLLERTGLDRIVGSSQEIEKLKKSLTMMSQAEAPVLLFGETGTGKSMIAQVIHETSGRSDKPFVKVDCASLPEMLIESELFGFEKGAFTGAVEARAGKFEQAHGGTLFLDEIGNIGQAVQAKLLNTLQDMVITRLGGTKPIRLDVRVISATNRNLEDSIQAGDFRNDLFYRLNVLHLTVPPLRERCEDIPLLCDHFMKDEFYRHSHSVKSIAPAVFRKLMAFAWPGNIRELYNTLLKSVVMCESRVLRPEDVLLPGADSAGVPAGRLPGRPRARKKRISIEKIRDMVEACNDNVQWAAEKLGISRNTVYYHLKKNRA